MPGAQPTMKAGAAIDVLLGSVVQRHDAYELKATGTYPVVACGSVL